MNALVVYGSQYGNTERIARVIGNELRGFGQARVVCIDPAQLVDLQGVDLLVVGCPTQGWGPTPAMRSFLEGIKFDRLRGPVVALFDTRFKMPRWMTGSAAEVMAGRLQEKGVSLLVPPESFFVKGKEGPLRNGELDRAAAWTRTLVEEVETVHPTAR